LKCNPRGRISEGLIRSQELKALAWGVVVAKEASLELLRGQGSENGFAGEVTAHAADGIFDAAFLPRFVGVAEESGKAQALGELVMQGELGPVIESDGLAQGGRKRLEPGEETFEHGLGGLVGLAGEAQMTGRALMENQDGLTILGEEHEIGFPMAGLGSVVGLRGAIMNRHAVLEVLNGTASAKAQAATPMFATRQEAVPVILLGGAMIDETIDRFVGDHGVAVGATESTGNLLRGPAQQQVLAHGGLELG
jgi:hypothetical protein